MAYNNYFPTGYQPYYQTYQPPINQQVQPVQQPTQSNNGLIWVQGETGAKSYMVNPNSTVMLMDSESDRFYLKSSDSSGMPLPLRIFEYKEVSNPVKQDLPQTNMDTSNYVTKDEFNLFKEEIGKLINSEIPVEKESDKNV